MSTKDMTSCKQAITNWQAANDGKDPATATVVKLLAQIPPIRKMDNQLNALLACEQLSMSTNCITQIQPLTLRNLKILSLGRNNIKRIERLDDVSSTLEELWLSYNSIEKLDGLKNLKKLKNLFLSNNKITNFDELSKLADLPNLENLLLLGNPMYKTGLDSMALRVEVIKRLPHLRKLDGRVVSLEEKEMAAGGELKNHD